MKLDSKYFDSIRLGAKRGKETAGPRPSGPRCQRRGCELPATHRAPKGRGHDGEYLHFCIDHVREYNATYNYFDGMSDSEVVDFQKDALTGHRPTWKLGANSWAHGTHQSGAASSAGQARSQSTEGAEGVEDAASFFAWRAKQSRAEPVQNRRHVRPLERKALDTLGLQPGTPKDEVKTRFKELVKLHHPDANGGDTRSEEKLREIIQAYNYLKQAGLV